VDAQGVRAGVCVCARERESLSHTQVTRGVNAGADVFCLVGASVCACAPMCVYTFWPLSYGCVVSCVCICVYESMRLCDP